MSFFRWFLCDGGLLGWPQVGEIQAMAAEFGLTCISAHRMDATKALLKPATAYPEEDPGEAP